VTRSPLELEPETERIAVKKRATMKISSLLAIVGLAISFALPALAQQKDTPDPKIRQLIDAHQKIYDEAMNNGDAAALANKMFTEDAVLVTDAGPIYGRAAIEKHYAEVFKQVHFSNFSGDVGTEYSAIRPPQLALERGGAELIAARGGLYLSPCRRFN
jgi:ketosteroid isomerase-like protein